MSPSTIPHLVRELMDVSTGFSIVFSIDGNFILGNKSFLEALVSLKGDDFSLEHADDLEMKSSNFKKRFFWNDIIEAVKDGNFSMNISFGDFPNIYKCHAASVLMDKINVVVMCMNEVTPSHQLEKKLMEKNGFFENLLDELPQMICALDENGIIRYWNDQCKAVLGYSSDDIVLKPDATDKLMPNRKYREDVLEKIYRKESGVLRFINTIMHSSDGYDKTIAWNVRFMNNPLIPGLNYWLVGTDITAMEVAMKSIVESEHRYSMISKASNDAVWDWDLISDQLWWNDGMTSLFGYDPEEIKNTYQWWLDRVHPSYTQAVDEKLRLHVEEGRQFWSDEYLFRKKDGTYALVFDKGYLIKDEKGRPIRFVGGIVDITHTKNLNPL